MVKCVPPPLPPFFFFFSHFLNIFRVKLFVINSYNSQIWCIDVLQRYWCKQWFAQCPEVTRLKTVVAIVVIIHYLIMVLSKIKC